MALKSICRDSMGIEAIKTDLKQIIIQNINGICYGDRPRFIY
ncbi:hypothetical protein [Aetokthonos hydrillicola]|jgi:hypothetical protein|nr:hypothetical protein [Aetokthonos hydrillicola]